MHPYYIDRGVKPKLPQVYVARCPHRGKIKVGASRCPLKRIHFVGTVQGETEQLLILPPDPNAFKLERMIHRKLRKESYSHEGEWYSASVNEVLAIVRDCIDEYLKKEQNGGGPKDTVDRK